MRPLARATWCLRAAADPAIAELGFMIQLLPQIFSPERGDTSNSMLYARGHWQHDRAHPNVLLLADKVGGTIRSMQRGEKNKIKDIKSELLAIRKDDN